jgi:hypothetical protein
MRTAIGSSANGCRTNSRSVASATNNLEMVIDSFLFQVIVLTCGLGCERIVGKRASPGIRASSLVFAVPLDSE